MYITYDCSSSSPAKTLLKDLNLEVEDAREADFRAFRVYPGPIKPLKDT